MPRRLIWLITGMAGLGLAVRLLWLDKIPTGFTHDEMFFAVEAQSVSLDGRDLTGRIRPWLQLTPSNQDFSELPGSILAPGFWLVRDPIIAARILDVIFGTLSPLLLTAIVWHFTKNRHYTLATAGLSLANPWLFQFSRSSIDPTPGFFLILLATWLHLTQSGKRRIWSLPFYLIGFFTYQGYKLIWLPLVILTTAFLLYHQRVTRRTWRQNWLLWLPAALMLVIFSVYVVRLRSQSAANRIGRILPFDQELLASLTNTERRLSLPSPLQPFVINKATVLGWRFLDQYTESFYLKTLFLRGEPGPSSFAVWSHGMFYAADAVFVAIGWLVLLATKKQRLFGLYLSAVALLAPLPTALNSGNLSIIFRSSLLVCPFLILAGVGLGHTWQNFNRYGRAALLGLYLLLIGHFAYEYFFRYPVYAADGLFLSDRVLSSYAHRAGKPVTVLSNDQPFFLFENYLFFNRQINRRNLPSIHTALAQENYHFNNVEFRHGCLDATRLAAGDLVIAAVDIAPCTEGEEASTAGTLSIARVLDSGEKYRIYNDALCQKTDMRPFLHLQDLNQFQVEKLSDQDFCENWITDLNPLRQP